MTRMPLTATIWDVQHGSAAWIQMPNGDNIVIDLGIGSIHSKQAKFSPLEYINRKRSVRQLDALVITHPHKDHIDDVVHAARLHPRVLKRPKLTAEQIRQGNPKDRDSAELAGYIAFDRRYSSPASASPLSATRSDRASITHFSPTRCPPDNLNNRSIVTVIEYANSKLLFPGDNEGPSWAELLARDDFVKAIRGSDVLVAAHHGREVGYCADLFDLIRPKLTLISDGPAPTSAVGKYKGVTTGWKTFYRRGGSERRFCLTTRRDDDIIVELGWNGPGRPYLKATAGHY
jgi:beta-lactamase superfamily II metal-dependent hydrolase